MFDYIKDWVSIHLTPLSKYISVNDLDSSNGFIHFTNTWKLKQVKNLLAVDSYIWLVATEVAAFPAVVWMVVKLVDTAGNVRLWDSASGILDCTEIEGEFPLKFGTMAQLCCPRLWGKGGWIDCWNLALVISASLRIFSTATRKSSFNFWNRAEAMRSGSGSLKNSAASSKRKKKIQDCWSILSKWITHVHSGRIPIKQYSMAPYHPVW